MYDIGIRFPYSINTTSKKKEITTSQTSPRPNAAAQLGHLDTQMPSRSVRPCPYSELHIDIESFRF